MSGLAPFSDDETEQEDVSIVQIAKTNPVSPMRSLHVPFQCHGWVRSKTGSCTSTGCAFTLEEVLNTEVVSLYPRMNQRRCLKIIMT